MRSSSYTAHLSYRKSQEHQFKSITVIYSVQLCINDKIMTKCVSVLPYKLVKVALSDAEQDHKMSTFSVASAKKLLLKILKTVMRILTLTAKKFHFPCTIQVTLKIFSQELTNIKHKIISTCIQKRIYKWSIICSSTFIQQHVLRC